MWFQPICFLSNRVIQSLPLGRGIGPALAVQLPKAPSQACMAKVACRLGPGLAKLLHLLLLEVQQEAGETAQTDLQRLQRHIAGLCQYQTITESLEILSVKAELQSGVNVHVAPFIPVEPWLDKDSVMGCCV